MPDKQNHALEHARKISDYFTMVLHIAIAAGAGFALLELAQAHPETAALNETIAAIIGLCAAYLSVALIFSLVQDMRTSRDQDTAGVLRWLELLLPLIALGFLISFIYFARTTAHMMM